MVSVCKAHEHNGWKEEEGDKKEEKRFLHQSIEAIGASVQDNTTVNIQLTMTGVSTGCTKISNIAASNIFFRFQVLVFIIHDISQSLQLHY